MKPEIDYSVYLVTDSELVSTKSLEQAVSQAIEGGCTLIQLREKKLSSQDFFHTASGIKVITDYYNIPLIINDRVDLALAVNAAGVHVGQNDLPAKIVRDIIGKNKILGVSVSNPVEAAQAERDGADYLGVGAMFATATKTDTELVSLESLKEIKRITSLPIVVIGGINKKTISLFNGLGIAGIAVVSAIISEKEVALAAAGIKQMFQKTKQDAKIPLER